VVLNLDELVHQITLDGGVIRAVTKQHAHKHGLLHRVVLGEVRDVYGNVVLVRQAHDRQDADLLVSPIGGHVRTDESVEQAMQREALEEIGISGFSSSLVGEFAFTRRVLQRLENHLFTVFLIRADPARFVLGSEATAIEVLPRSELLAHLATSPGSFGGAFHALVAAGFTELGLAQ